MSSSSLFKRIIAPTILLFLLATGLRAEPDFTRPKSHLGLADKWGCMYFWTDLASIPIKDGESIPVRLRFTTGVASSGAPIFGRYWWCPILESSLVMTGEKVMEMTTLGGRRVALNAQKDGTFQSGDGRYTGRIVSPSETKVSADGWEYRYIGGRLRSAKEGSATDLDWTYQGTRLLSITDAKGIALLSLEYSGNESIPTAIVVGKERFDLKAQQVPLVTDLMGQSLVAGFANSLAEIRNSKISQNFPIKLERSGDCVMEYSSNYWPARDYRWKATSGVIKSDGEWTYEVEPQEKALPLISRTNKDGGTESYFFNVHNGTSVNKLPDGSVVSRAYFSNSGPTYNKIRKLTVTKNGEEILSKQWSYDEVGRLIRERSGDYEHLWSWSPKGDLTEETESVADKISRKTVFDETGRPIEKIIGDKTYHYAYEGGNTVIQRVEPGRVITKVLNPARGQQFVFLGNPKDGSFQGHDVSLKAGATEALGAAQVLATKVFQNSQNELVK
jgi:hypothetical protein